MTQPPVGELDATQEFQIRSWAREHYVPAHDRDPLWHPIVHDEMERRDRELAESRELIRRAYAYVPLAPDSLWRFDPRQPSPRVPKLLLTLAEIPQIK